MGHLQFNSASNILQVAEKMPAMRSDDAGEVVGRVDGSELQMIGDDIPPPLKTNKISTEHGFCWKLFPLSPFQGTIRRGYTYIYIYRYIGYK